MSGQERVGISADGVEGDVAEVEQASQSHDDVEAPTEHHVNENLDAEIVDPLHRSLPAREPEREHGIKHGKAKGERNHRACEVANPACLALASRSNSPAGEPGRNQERMRESRAGDDRDHRAQQWPARLENELVMNILD